MLYSSKKGVVSKFINDIDKIKRRSKTLQEAIEKFYELYKRSDFSLLKYKSIANYEYENAKSIVSADLDKLKILREHSDHLDRSYINLSFRLWGICKNESAFQKSNLLKELILCYQFY